VQAGLAERELKTYDLEAWGARVYKFNGRRKARNSQPRRKLAFEERSLLTLLALLWRMSGAGRPFSEDALRAGNNCEVYNYKLHKRTHLLSFVPRLRATRTTI